MRERHTHIQHITHLFSACAAITATLFPNVITQCALRNTIKSDMQRCNVSPWEKRERERRVFKGEKGGGRRGRGRKKRGGVEMMSIMNKKKSWKGKEEEEQEEHKHSHTHTHTHTHTQRDRERERERERAGEKEREREREVCVERERERERAGE